jgi:hypothetical protein
MPGPPVRFDYQSFDPASGRLYIAHMNADQLDQPEGDLQSGWVRPGQCPEGQRHHLSHHQRAANGKRSGRTPKLASNTWHTLRVDFQDNHFTVTFDGKKAIEWDDNTFKEAGKVGVWTKADSVTLFDDFTYGAK